MMNEGLFRALHADREREIRDRLRDRAMLGSAGDRQPSRAADRATGETSTCREQQALIRAREA